MALAALLLMGGLWPVPRRSRQRTARELRARPRRGGRVDADRRGQGKVERIVPVNARSEVALRAHWRDRDLDFDNQGRRGYLIALLATPGGQGQVQAGEA